MKKQLISLSALGFLLAALLAVALPARAENFGSRIQALEDEIARLKAEQAQTREEQMELKKEATAAKGAQPDWRFRPRSGLRIRAADKSWEIRFGYVFHGRVAFFGSQQDDDRRVDGQYWGRRNRPLIRYFWNKGFYSIYWMLDQDADQGQAPRIQRARFEVHYEQMHPWLPQLHIGMDIGATINWHDTNWSSSTSGHLERSILVRNNGVNTATHTGAALVWNNVPLPLLPGTGTFEIHYIDSIAASDGQGDDSDRKDWILFAGLKPWSKSKNKWMKGIDFGIGIYLGPVDSAGDQNQNRRLRLRDHGQAIAGGGNERNTLFDNNNIDDGLHTYITPFFGWRVGPYRLRTTMGFDSWEDKANSTDGNNNAGSKGGLTWSIAHELFIWSPKGLFTGNSNGPHSWMLSWMFERSEAHCRGTGDGVAGFCDAGGQYNRNRILLRELNLWWFVMRSVSVGVSWLWYDAANVRTGDQADIRCSRNNNTRAGKDCDWSTVVLGLRVGF